jgi:hypothetical protein
MNEYSHFVYVAECGLFHKVGMSSSPKKRLSALLGSNPYSIEMIFTAELENRFFAYNAEQLAHKKLKRMGYHHRGEWFKGCSKNLVFSIVKDSCLEVSTKENKLKHELKKRRIKGPKNKWKGFSLMIRKEHDIIIKKSLFDSYLIEMIKAIGVKEMSILSGVRIGILSNIVKGSYFEVTVSDVKKAAAVFDDKTMSYLLRKDLR